MKTTLIKELIRDSILGLLNNTIADVKIKKIIEKHEAKTHFIPIKYRIFGGLLQSLNIQFGNFIEVLMQKIIEKEARLQIVAGISGKKNVPLSLTEEADSMIDRFITGRQNKYDPDLGRHFSQLMKEIIKAQRSDADLITIKHDIDVLFKDENSGNLYYIELKYNDDHDTGKFVDINRKFIKTYAGLLKTLNIKSVSALKPILYYFNQKVMKGNIYVPEQTNIYRGKKLFDEFLSVNYKDVDDCLTSVSEDKATVKIFDDLFRKIRYGK